MKESDPWVIVDLDGTLVDSSHRHHLIPQGERRNDVAAWASYEHSWYRDQPYDDVLALVRGLKGFFNVAIVTARNERMREGTTTWLMEWGIDFEELHMREKDGVPAEQLKGHIVVESFFNTGRTVLFAVEDDANVVNAYVWIGVPTLHVRR